jgi:hypothetical protein
LGIPTFGNTDISGNLTVVGTINDAVIVSRPSNLEYPQQPAISSTSANTVVIGGNIAPLCDTLNSVLIGTNSSTTGYGVGTSVVIGYNNLF